MGKNYEGNHDGSGVRVCIIRTRWNEDLVGEMNASARARLAELGVEEDNIHETIVPGAFEIPGAAKALAETTIFDALIALGVVIRGETAHFDYVAGEAARGITEVTLTTGVPIIFGILTTENRNQAVRRAAQDQDNKGREYAEAAIEMANLRAEIRKDDTSWQTRL